MTQIYVTEKLVTREVVENSHISEEVIKRTLIAKLLESIPLEKLEYLFSVEKTDPQTEKSAAILANPREEEFVKKFLLLLKEDNCILYRAEITL